MTLVELYNKNCVSYYGIEYSAERLFIGDDKESEAVRCKEFMHEHYMAGKNMNCLTALCTRNMSQKVNMFIQYRYICLERHFCHTFNKK